MEHISYTSGTCALPDIYTLALRPAGLGLVCIYQESTRACGITITFIYLFIYRSVCLHQKFMMQ